MEINNPFPIGKRITEIREAKGYTINSLANKTGISQSYLRDLELGYKTNPSVEIIYLVCNALNVDLSEFFNSAIETNNFEENDPLIKRINQMTNKQRDTLLSFLNEVKF